MREYEIVEMSKPSRKANILPILHPHTKFQLYSSIFSGDIRGRTSTNDKNRSHFSESVKAFGEAKNSNTAKSTSKAPQSPHAQFQSFSSL